MQPPKHRVPLGWLPAPRFRVLSAVRGLVPKTGYDLVRMGHPQDGGYLLPNDLQGLVGCLSPGVSTKCDFDLDIANTGVPVVMADASVSGPPQQHPNFTFVKKFVGPRETESETRLQTLASSLADGDLLLQMDIEGAEYDVIEAMPENLLRRFRIMVIEFHALHRWVRHGSIVKFQAILDKLLTYHVVAHVHPNNCLPLRRVSGVSVPPVLEVTFYRKDRAAAAAKGPVRIPHPLDADNVPYNPTIALPDWGAIPA